MHVFSHYPGSNPEAVDISIPILEMQKQGSGTLNTMQNMTQSINGKVFRMASLGTRRASIPKESLVCFV